MTATGLLKSNGRLNHPEERKEFQVDIEISAFDRQGVLNEVMMVISETKTPIVAVSGK